jgi:COP9 signalosome complex subunit 5
VSTQLSWQLSEDAAANPFLAIVVDPLRSVAKGVPELGAFRCYPPGHMPERGLAPDGVVWDDEHARSERWGASAMSYYQLEVEYFMSSFSYSLLDVLSRGHLWTRMLASTPMLEKEVRHASCGLREQCAVVHNTLT